MPYKITEKFHKTLTNLVFIAREETGTERGRKKNVFRMSFKYKYLFL